jgi:CubicO group peptidase (beta-lactamase class C family)
MHNQGDLINYCLSKKTVEEPGIKFNYHSGLSTMLGEIIRRKTGLPADKFAQKHLFEPLGIKNWIWWKDKSDKNKLLGTGGGLSLTSRGLLKIGILTLNKGMWNGVQVVSKEWTNESTKRQISTGTRWYGYQWWMRDFVIDDKTISCFYAMGLYGKFLFVFPELNLIIVSTAENYNNFWSRNVYNFIQKYILPSVIIKEDPFN